MAVWEKINRLKNWQASLVIVAIGFLTYFDSLRNAFQGDDLAQIVNNPVVHSLSNIKLFFEGGTFYTGHGIAPLSGVYFRPLMTTVFSLLYSLFGPHPFYFHLFQLLLCIGSAIILYLFFRYSFKPPLALFLSLVFLVHPIDSQVVLAISAMQDALFLFFGILALYLLVRFNSKKSLALVALCLFLALLSKESAVVFVAISLLYLFWRNRNRFHSFTFIVIAPVGLWLALKINAIGLLGKNPMNAQIDSLSLGGRLLTDPSILLFYISKLLFPLKLASSYYWVYPRFSFMHFVVPLFIDLIFIGLVITVGRELHKRSTKSMFHTYLFFSTWTALGLLTCLQMIPLDMTACQNWFYFSMAGALGMLGVVLTVFSSKFKLEPVWIIATAVIVLVLLGTRTALWGRDYTDVYVLASSSVLNSSSNYTYYTTIASLFLEEGDYEKAQTYAQKSVDLYPSDGGYDDLGLSLAGQGNYTAALRAYNSGLKYSNSTDIYDNIAALTLVYGSPRLDKQVIQRFTSKYPEDPKLWWDLAMLEDEYNNNSEAQAYMLKAASLGRVPKTIYTYIMNDQQFIFSDNALNIMDIKIPNQKLSTLY